MKVLIGGEYSGKMRDAFIARGHDALSCDLLPTEVPGPHYQGDVFDVIDYPWDLAIFHPECTHTAVSGARHFREKWSDGRQACAVSFFMRLVRRSAHIPKRAIEQPISIMSSLFRKPDCIVQPWQHGHGETKATCFWLWGLPPLEPTNVVAGRDGRIWKMSPSADRWKERSRTFDGIASAAAEQWGGPIVGRFNGYATQKEANEAAAQVVKNMGGSPHA